MPLIKVRLSGMMRALARTTMIGAIIVCVDGPVLLLRYQRTPQLAMPLCPVPPFPFPFPFLAPPRMNHRREVGEKSRRRGRWRWTDFFFGSCHEEAY